MASGQITEEKYYDINAVLWEKYRAFYFNVWKFNLFSFWAITISDNEDISDDHKNITSDCEDISGDHENTRS